MEPKREPKWRPKASQDGTKKEKKSEVKLRELSEALEAKKRNERRSRVSSYEAAGGGKGRQEHQKATKERRKTDPRPPQDRTKTIQDGFWNDFSANI